MPTTSSLDANAAQPGTTRARALWSVRAGTSLAGLAAGARFAWAFKTGALGLHSPEILDYLSSIYLASLALVVAALPAFLFRKTRHLAWELLLGSIVFLIAAALGFLIMPKS